MNRILRLAAIGLAFVLGIAGGTVLTQSLVQHRKPGDVVGGYVSQVFVPPPQTLLHTDRIALLLIGIDYNYTDRDIEYSANARTDTLKAVSLAFPSALDPSGAVSILSVPRDTFVTLPNGEQDRINAAYGLGSTPQQGAHDSEVAVASFLGIPKFDRYLTLRIDATKDLIDAIGGIDVVPDETMNYDDNWGHLHIHFVGGKLYHMNGDQAVSYARFRHDACSDPCRIKRQDQVIRIALAKLESNKFNDLLHIRELIGVVRKDVYTDLSPQEMLSLAWAFRSLKPAQIASAEVPYATDEEVACCGDVLVADQTAKAQLVAKMFLDPIAPQVTPNPSAVAAIAPSSVRVEVLNGSGIVGAAGKVAAALRKQGFAIAAVSDAANFGYDTTQIDQHSQTQPLAGERVRQALQLPGAAVVPTPSPSGSTASDVTVIVGRDLATPALSEASAAQ
ncbi:MAG: LCP family protein [Vulcanimicrobiaceae bacterium]